MGMYIHDLNVPWMKHSFARNRFMLQNEKQIEKILRINIPEVLIDTSKGIDAVHAPSREEAEAKLMDRLIDIAAEPVNLDTSHMESLWAESRQIHYEAVKVVGDVLNDIRLGKQVSVEKAEPIVANIANAVLANDGTLVSLCRIKQRDTYTFQHSVSISALLVTFGHAIGGFSDENLMEIGLGGMFHDVGKMKIPLEILNKPGRLSEAEFGVMRTHVAEGVNYLKENGNLSVEALKIVEEHHERYDGAGYPMGLSRNAISRLGQMATIVDVYDAITSIRAYHSALEPVEALKRIFEWGGRHFDVTLVEKFIKAIGIYPVGSLVRLESGRLAIVLRQGEHNLLQPIVRVVYNAVRGHRLPLQDINLASPSCQDQIIGYELSSTWGIDPIKFLGKKTP